MANFRSWLQWVDSQGGQRLTRYDTAGSLQAGLVRVAVTAVSNAGQLAVTAATVGGPYGVPPGPGNYISVDDFAELWFIDTGGDQFTFTLPAPFDTLFQADGITWGTGVVPTGVASVLIANLVNPATGLAVQGFYGGVRKGKSSG